MNTGLKSREPGTQVCSTNAPTLENANEIRRSRVLARSSAARMIGSTRDPNGQLHYANRRNAPR